MMPIVWRCVLRGDIPLRFDGVNDEFLRRVAFDTPNGETTLGMTEVAARRIHFDYETRRPSQLILLLQARSSYRPDRVDEISRSIHAIGQQTPTVVARLTSEEACQRYLDGLNAEKGTQYRVGEFPVVPDENGVYEIVVAGHTRTLGNVVKNWRLSGASELDPDVELMPCQIMTNPTFEQAFDIQLVENACRQNLEPWEESLVFAKRIQTLRATGNFVSIVDTANTLGVSEKRLRASMRFAELPPMVRSLVIGDHQVFAKIDDLTALEHAVSVELWPLMEVYTHSELFEIALVAAKEKWSTKRAKAEVLKYQSLRKLPDKVARYLAAADLPLDFAPLIVELMKYYSDERMIYSLIRTADSANWDYDKFNEHVRDLIAKAEYQQFSLLSEDYLTTATASSHAGLETRRLTTATREIRRQLALARQGLLDGGTIDLMARSVQLEEALSELEELISEIHGITADDPERMNGLRYPIERLLGTVTLVNANRSGLPPVDLVELSGGTIRFDPDEREIVQAEESAEPLPSLF